jgi:glycosyltransferase involved in cell wall biosynthesis
LANNPSILHIVKWFPHEADPQNGIFIQRHIESVTPFADNYILFIRETVQPESMKVRKYHHMAGLVYEITLSASASGLKKQLMKFAALQQFIQTVRKPQLIHFHIATPDQALAAFVARLRGIPYVVSEHWGGYLDVRFTKMPFLKKWFIKTMLKKAKRVLVVSKYLMHGMMQVGIHAKFRIIPNVVLVPDFRQLKFPDFTFCVLADLADDIKNISGAIKAFAQHHTSHKNSRLEIIGGGPDEAYLRQMAFDLGLTDAVVFHGRKKQEAAMELLASCHCLMINSYRETFSVVGLEALGLGLPVISTRCGGPEEYLNDRLGILIPVADHDALVLAMEKMQREYVLYVSHVQSFDRERYAMPQVGERLHRLYAEIIA